VAALGFDTIFPALIYSDAFGRDHWKPGRTPYLKLMEKFGCQGAGCIYVADNPAKDFVSAKVLGWFTVQICRPGGEYVSVAAPEEYQADMKVSSLCELPEVLLARLKYSWSVVRPHAIKVQKRRFALVAVGFILPP
jgi:putative hydrolase of the HAD superfamily